MHSPILSETPSDYQVSTPLLEQDSPVSEQDPHGWMPDFAGWYQDLTSGDEQLLDFGSACWLTSLIVHFVLLVTLAIVAAGTQRSDSSTTLVISAPDAELTEPDIDELSLNITDSENSLEDIGGVSLGEVEAAAPPPMNDVVDMPDMNELDAGPVEASKMDVTLQELASNDNAGFITDMAGIPGVVVNAHGDAGSVDRLTAEILTRLELSKVLIVWLMDASESLRPRREQIIKHFTRIYTELDELAEDSGDALLTSVIAFGADLDVKTPKPTADREEILAAVRDIKSDTSGVENVFAAVHASAMEYAKFQRAGRHVMLIVVTDETGNDADKLDATLAMLKRHSMTVHVIGPIAPFAQQEITVKWTDPETKENFYVPVDAGPETAYVEQAALDVWDNGPGSAPRSSGFGPYALTRLTHENGGMYLLHDDGRIPGPSFEVDRLRLYRPDYVSDAQYKKLADEHPLRLAVLRTAQATNQYLTEPLPRTMLAAGIQFEIKPASKKLQKVSAVLDAGLSTLQEVEEARKNETSRRWLAHYDLLRGRLLANKVRCNSYAQLLQEMYAKPREPVDGTKNAWRATGLPLDEATEDEATEKEPAGDKTSADKAPPPERDDIKRAREQLERVVQDHADTPWAAIAKDELKFSLSFQWREAFMEPPEGVPLPWDKKPWSELTKAQKVAKVAYEKKKAARKRKVKAKPGAKKRGPPKL